jgi:MOSC domain-containing protein YiiM
MKGGRVKAIHVAPDSGDPMESVRQAEVVADRGIRGDRYFEEQGLWNLLDQDPDRDAKGASDITFIEAEALEAVERDASIPVEAGVHRRNITTQHVPLNHLVGRRFEVGNIVCEGIELCEPCGYMQSLVAREGLSDALVHRGGLNARVVESGQIEVGDSVR